MESDREFQTQSASYNLENDWMDWQFALESLDYWQNSPK